jgi:hypothetical protein
MFAEPLKAFEILIVSGVGPVPYHFVAPPEAVAAIDPVNVMS